MAGAVPARSRLPVEEESADGLVIRARELADLAVSDPVHAEDQVHRLVTVAQRADAREALVIGLRALAMVHSSRWEHAVAARLLGRAIRLGRQFEMPFLEAEARGARAAVRHGQGRLAAARRDIDTGLVLLARAEGVPDPERGRLDAYLELQLAVLDHNAGRYRQAEGRYRRIAVNPHRSDDVAVRVANNLALVLALRGEYGEALVSSRQAVELAERLGPVTAAVASQTHAWIVVREGRLAQGLAEFDEVALAYERAGTPLGEYHVELADAMADLRLLPEATSAAQAAADEFAAAGVWLMWLEAQVRLARLHLAAGQPWRARELAAEAVARGASQRRTAWRDRARLVDAQAGLALGEPSAADLAAVRRAAVRFEESGDLVDAVESHLTAGRLALAAGRRDAGRGELVVAGRLAARGPLLLRVQGRLARATAARVDGDGGRVVREARAGLRDLAAHRGTLPTMELRALASGHGAELGEIGLSELLRDGTPHRVLRWMEQTRAAAILARLPVGEEVPQVAPTGGGVDWHVPPGPAEIRRALDGRVLVELGACEGRYVAVVVGRRGSRLVDLGRQDDVVAPLRALVFALRRLADPRSSAAAQAARQSAELRLRTLREALVAPLGVAPDDELVVVPVGALHGVPWSALHGGPTAVAPSATAWVGTAVSRAAAGTVLVAGPGLTGAQEEVDALAAVHPGATVFGPGESRVAPVTSALASADLAHLACHGVPRADNPMFSSLVLADGPVTVQELHRAGVAPRRLVLASCHSGADTAYAGDEVLGFVSAMLARGTAGIVANIAAVPDVEVVDLMLALHRHLAAGETMARALHGARGQIDRDAPTGFVNWCTFGAHGAA